MKEYTVVDKNGKILRSGLCQDETFEAQALDQEDKVYEGQYSPFIFYFKNNQFHQIPDQPSKLHVWDENDCVWKATKSYSLDQIRIIRNAKLRGSDWTDTYSAEKRLSEQEFNAWQVYRQALRDITINIDLNNVIWPTPPNASNLFSVESFIERQING
jgi:hypothetical protein